MKRQANSRRKTSATPLSSAGPVWAAQILLFSLLLPFRISVGSLLLMPHRIVILALFLPFLIRLFLHRKAGPVLAIDWLLFASAIWVGVALIVNHPFGVAIEPFGIHLIEFFGGYLIARVAIRSAEDFQRVVQLFFLILLLLLPFAAIESISRQPILLQLFPWESVAVINADIRFGMRRAQSVFAHPILFGVFVSSGMGLFWYSLRPTWLRFPAAIAVALSTLFSLSTGALLSLVAQSVFIGWEAIMRAIRGRWTVFAIFAVVGYTVIDLISSRTPFHVLVTYASFSTTSAYNRILIWQYGTENVWSNPLFGLGLNDWIRPSWMSSSVDNFWLLLTMQYGLPAILMISIAISMIIRRISRAALVRPLDNLCRSGYLVTIGGIIFAGGTVHYWQTMMAFVMFIIGSGIWIVSGGSRGSESAKPETGSVTRRLPYTRQQATGRATNRGISSQKASAEFRSEPHHRN